MPKTLQLALKKKWFDMIKAGIKKEEYREINNYWKSRFIAASVIFTGQILAFSKFENIVFTLGYPKSTDNERRLEFNNPKIQIGEGRPEWGAEPGKLYFVITWEN